MRSSAGTTARGALAVLVTALTAAACGGGRTPAAPARTGPDIGVEVATLSVIVDHPFVAFSLLRRAIYEGEEIDGKEKIKLRVESVTRETTKTVADVDVLVVDVTEYEDGELVEKTEDYYAQQDSGVVYYMGESVNDYENGKLTGHHGEWLPGSNGALAGVFMPTDPQLGDVFEQERAPKIAEDVSKVIRVGVHVTVPAGSFDDCIETEDYDPIGASLENKFYCRGVGLVREVFPKGGSLDLVEYELR